MVVLRNFAVVLQSFFPSGFLPGRGERDVANFKQLGSGEEQHVRRIVIQRIHQTAFVEDDDSKSDFLCFDGAGEAGRPGANYQHVRALLRMRANFGLGQSFNVFGSEKVRHGAGQKPMILARWRLSRGRLGSSIRSHE